MDSVISWVGGKKRLRQQIINLFPNEKLKLYVEVFGGAGWVLFAKDKHANYEVYNDINKNLVSLFRCIKYHREELEKQIEFNLFSREEFFYQKKMIMFDNLTDIQRAAIFFTLIKHSFGSKGLDFATRSRSKKSALIKFEELSNRLEKVIIEKKDFENLISTYDGDDTLFYLDPPYYNAEKYYNQYELNFNKDDHLRLKKKLENIKGKWILSYNNCPYILELYQNYNISEIKRNEGLNAKYNNKKFSEIIIRNYK